MSKSILVFQHTVWEKPGGLFLEAAARLKVSLEIIKLWKQAIPPSPLSGYDGLVVLRGNPEASRPGTYKFLEVERAVIAESINEDRPYLGIGLGHLLLAGLFGAAVGNNYCASIGFVDGFLTQRGEEHPLFKKIPSRLPLFKWHNQAVMAPIPRNIDILATSTECQFEAVSIPGRPHIVGLQFDNNAAAKDDVESYLQKDRKWLSSFTGKYIDPAAILADAGKLQRTTSRHFRQIFSNFLKMI